MLELIDRFHLAWLAPALGGALWAWFSSRGANGDQPLWPDGDPTAPGWYRDYRRTEQASWAPGPGLLRSAFRRSRH